MNFLKTFKTNQSLTAGYADIEKTWNFLNFCQYLGGYIYRPMKKLEKI